MKNAARWFAPSLESRMEPVQKKKLYVEVLDRLMEAIRPLSFRLVRSSLRKKS